MRLTLLVFTLLGAGAIGAQPIVPGPARGPMRHFVFFGRTRERIADTAFLANPGVAGAQLTYTWRELEPKRDVYDLAIVEADLALLTRYHKRLWIQLQDVGFSENARILPTYLLEDSAFHGGDATQVEGGRFAGRMARRWDPAVRARFARLLDTLGRAFDGRIEGINFAESSFSIGEAPEGQPTGFTYESYANGLKSMMSTGRAAFRRSIVMVYGNFMPGEWLPDEDRGYLRGVYAHADSIGVAVGGPDLLPFRRGQRAHSLRLIAARGPATIAGLAVQDGNLAELDRSTGERASVQRLVRFAADTLRLDYLFWGTEEPYYTRDILPWLARTTTP